MTPEAQQIAIAEACGFTGPFEEVVWYTVQLNAWRGGIRREVPRYSSDLNAMHEAEKTLSADLCAKYANHLMTYHPTYCTDVIDGRNKDEDVLCETFSIIHATAAQRAKAFLKTLDKWDDTK